MPNSFGGRTSTGKPNRRSKYLNCEWKDGAAYKTVDNVHILVVKAEMLCKIRVVYNRRICFNIVLVISVTCTGVTWPLPERWHIRVRFFSIIYATLNVTYVDIFILYFLTFLNQSSIIYWLLTLGINGVTQFRIMNQLHLFKHMTYFCLITLFKTSVIWEYTATYFLCFACEY